MTLLRVGSLGPAGFRKVNDRSHANDGWRPQVSTVRRCAWAIAPPPVWTSGCPISRDDEVEARREQGAEFCLGRRAPTCSARIPLQRNAVRQAGSMLTD